MMRRTGSKWEGGHCTCRRACIMIPETTTPLSYRQQALGMLRKAGTHGYGRTADVCHARNCFFATTSMQKKTERPYLFAWTRLRRDCFASSWGCIRHLAISFTIRAPWGQMDVLRRDLTRREGVPLLPFARMTYCVFSSRREGALTRLGQKSFVLSIYS